MLVVIGHAWEPLRAQNVGGRVLEAAQTFVYAFHLPVFIVMCGYFSRGFTAGRDRTRKLAATIVVPYVIFSVAYPLWAGLLAGDHVGWDPARAVLSDLVHARAAAVAAVHAAVAAAPLTRSRRRC